MRNLFISLAFFIQAFVFSLDAPAQQTFADMIAEVKPSVVSILTFDGRGKALARGTGFCVGIDSIVTNRHVIKGSASIQVLAGNGIKYKVIEPASLDDKADLALLKTEKLPLSIIPLAMSDSPIRQGDRVLVIGSPLGLQGSVTDGIVSAFRSTDGLGDLVQISAPISPGSSGSPVVNARGEVVGVATLNLPGGQNLNFAIPVARVLAKWKDIPGMRVMASSTRTETVQDLTTDEFNERRETEAAFERRVLANFGSRWLWYGTDVHKCMFFYDPNSIIADTRMFNRRSVWIRQACFRSASIFRTNLEINRALGERNVAYGQDKLEVYCDDRKVSIELVSYFDDKGKELTSTRIGYLAEITPNSTMENLLKKVCK